MAHALLPLGFVHNDLSIQSSLRIGILPIFSAWLSLKAQCEKDLNVISNVIIFPCRFDSKKHKELSEENLLPLKAP